MGRLVDTILDQGEAYASETGALTLNLERGGQWGYNPKLGIIGADGTLKSEWLANKAYTRRNIIPILVEAPRFFSKMPNSERWVGALKAMMETQVRVIDGLNATLNVEFGEHPIGGDGKQMSEVINVTREQSNVTLTFTEKEGRSISRFWETYIQWGMMHAETKFPLLSTLGDAVADVDMLPDWQSFTMLFIEPDAMHRKVVHAWLGGYLMPSGSGEILGKFDKTAANEVVEINIELKGFYDYNESVTNFAQKVLDEITLVNANPNLRPAFADKVDSEVDAVEVGYKPDIDKVRNSVA